MNNKTMDFHVQGPQINQFNNITPQAVPRSVFQRDFTRRSTFDADLLIPIFVDEILPGDDVNIRMTAFTRMSTPIKPLMDNLYLETFWFFIPNRLVWENWERFQGQQNFPGESTALTIPVLDNTVAPMSTTGFLEQSIYDYLGLPIKVTSLDNISALFNRAYDLCYNEWFRDENLMDSVTVETGDGPDNPSFYTLKYRRKKKDYLSSALPWPQKGDPVTIPVVGGTFPVRPETPTTPALFRRGPTLSSGLRVNPNVSGKSSTYIADSNTTDEALYWGYKNAEYDTGLEVDFGDLNSITINALRQAALYQQILELDARGGTRYVESIYSRFGVISPDFRLQRPELIGQASSRINIYSVPQTAPTATGQTPQGNLAAFGTNVINGDHGARYSATEHGIILGILNVRADLTYQQAVPKMFTRRTRLDFYEPLLNGLGEQAVLNSEIYAQGTSTDQQVFGYQERFAEYRFKNSEITGLMRTAATGTLNIWNVSQQFGSLPVLNEEFVTYNTPMDRVLAVPSEPAFLFDASFNYNHVRPMPVRSNPGIDRL